MQTFELVTRTCKCGCGETFKVLPTSQSFYAASSHDPERSVWMKKDPKERYKEDIVSYLEKSKDDEEDY